jgi:hypothetical protein
VPTLFDVKKTILTNNLFGVDLNGEAVEIARRVLDQDRREGQRADLAGRQHQAGQQRRR